jgi:putative phosphoesterase
MKIIVLSDTHIPVNSKDLPARILKEIDNADLLLHAGDFVSLELLERLKSHIAVKAVYGNMDSLEVRRALPEKEIFSVGKFKVCLIHGWGAPAMLIDAIKSKVLKDKPDIVVFGHSHYPETKIIEGVIYFNPGSPTDKIFSPYNSFGIIEIEDRIKTKIVKL